MSQRKQTEHSARLPLVKCEIVASVPIVARIWKVEFGDDIQNTEEQ